MENRLLFVYNADTGFFNLAADIAHKLFSPQTYACSLCALTYGVFSIQPEWEEFVRQAPVPFDFLHRDEFHAAHFTQREIPLPAIFLQSTDTRTLLFSALELGRFQRVADLKTAILQRLQDMGNAEFT